jgi:hypothetical protein
MKWVLFISKKEWITEICHKMDEPMQHFNKGKKAIIKDT